MTIWRFGITGVLLATIVLTPDTASAHFRKCVKNCIAGLCPNPAAPDYADCVSDAKLYCFVKCLLGGLADLGGGNPTLAQASTAAQELLANVEVSTGENTIIEDNVLFLGAATLGNDVLIGPATGAGVDPDDATTAVGPGVVIGDQSTIGAGVYLLHSAHLGRFAHVEDMATIMHNVEIGEHAFLDQGSQIKSHARLGNGVEVGAQTIIHPRCQIESNVLLSSRVEVLDATFIGEESVIYDGAHIGSGQIGDNASIGQNVYIDNYSILGSGNELDMDVVIWSGVSLGNECSVGFATVIENDVVTGDNVTIGAHRIIGQGVTIGDNVHIGDGGHIATLSVVGSHVTMGDDASLWPGAQLADGVSLGTGCAVGAAEVGHDSTFGADCQIWSGAQIGSEGEFGEGVIIREDARVGNQVRCGDGVEIDGGAVIGDRVAIADDVHIPAGAEIPDDTILSSNPEPPSDPEPPHPCIPTCGDRACGDDGCGDQCGTCPPGAVCVGGRCGIQAQNPLLTGNHPDPDVLRVTDERGVLYYLVHTTDNGRDIPIYTSRDLVHWDLLRGALGIGRQQHDVTDNHPIEVNNAHFCHVWAPNLVDLPIGYMLGFSAVRSTLPQTTYGEEIQTPTCSDYSEDGGVYLAWSPRLEDLFAPTDQTWEPLPAGAHSTCELRGTLPRSLSVSARNCQNDECRSIIRLDSDVWQDPLTQRWWMTYSWFTNDPPMNEWERDNHGQHVAAVELDGFDPFVVRCDQQVSQVLIGNPHEPGLIDRLASADQSCRRCAGMLSNTRGRWGEEMTRSGFSWGINEGPSLFRRGEYVYALMSGSAFDSPYYHVFWIAARSVEELAVGNPDRLVGRLLIPSPGHSFGHGTPVLGPDGESWFYVHHRLKVERCQNGAIDDCSRDLWITPIEFEDRSDGLGPVYLRAQFPAETPNVLIPLP